MIIRGVGSSEVTTRNDVCCDNCGGGTKLLSRLDFLKHVPAKRNKRKKAVRTVDHETKQRLRLALFEEGKKILVKEPGYRILGSEFVLSTSCISQICELAPIITSKDELGDLVAL